MFTTARGWSAATAVVAVLLTTAVWFLLISPARAEATATREQTVAAQSTNAELVVRLEQLEQQFVELPAKEAELAAVSAAMPEDGAIPELIRTVNAYAADTGVTLMSLAPGVPVVAGADPAAVAPAAAVADGTAAPAPAAPTGPVTVSIPLVTTVVGDYPGVRAFMQELQTGTRAHLVTDLSLTAESPAQASGGKPTTRAGDVTMTVTGSVFALRDPSVAPSVAAAPTAGAAPAPPTVPAPAPTAVAS
jgi:Tfp pilus assembly protein PilO